MAENTVRAVEGTRDFHGQDGRFFDAVLAAAADVFGRHGYAHLATPIFESTDLFCRSLGAATDIVEKEMYTFTPGSESITLRPEGTAGVVRACLQHHLIPQGSLAKWWYAGPMFRRERPQKGRYRQFHQVGVEALGADDPLLDAETVTMGLRLFEAVGVEATALRLNSIGCRRDDCRPRYRETLRAAIAPRLEEYCPTCRKRYDRNVLRILDCKNPGCRALSEHLPKSYECLCAECDAHFDAVREALEAAGAPFTLDFTLVRGLDYYTRTVWEYTHGALGAQDAMGGGGRYDGLAEELGGPRTPAVGFAAGVERIMLAMAAGRGCRCETPLQVFGVALGDGAKKAMAGLLARLREEGLSCDMEYGEPKSMKAQLRAANRRLALVALILGEDELARGEIVVKNMREGGGQVTAPIYEYHHAVRAALP